MRSSAGQRVAPFFKKEFNLKKRRVRCQSHFQLERDRRARRRSHVQLERDRILYKISNYGVQSTKIPLSLPCIIAYVVHLQLWVNHVSVA